MQSWRGTKLSMMPELLWHGDKVNKCYEEESWKGAVASPIGESTLKPPKVECPKIACECTQASDSTCIWIYCIHNVRNVIREPAMITWCIARKPFKQMHARQQVNQWQVHNKHSKAVASSRGHCCWSHHQQSSMLNFHASCGSAPSRSEAATFPPMTFLSFRHCIEYIFSKNTNSKTWCDSDSFTGHDLICLSRLNLQCLHKDTESLCNGRFILVSMSLIFERCCDVVC